MRDWKRRNSSFAANDANGRSREREKREREPPISPLLPPSRSLAFLSPSPSAASDNKPLSIPPIQKKTKTKTKTDGLKHFSSLPSPWGVPLVGHGPLLGRAPAATLKRWADKYGGVYR